MKILDSRYEGLTLMDIKKEIWSGDYKDPQDMVEQNSMAVEFSDAEINRLEDEFGNYWKHLEMAEEAEAERLFDEELNAQKWFYWARCRVA